MKKILCIGFALLLFATVCFAADETITFDFPNIMSENPDDLPENVDIENGFHNSIWIGKLSTTCTLGLPVTYRFDNLNLEGYGAASFGLMSQHADENSSIDLTYITESGKEFTDSIPLTTTAAKFYTVKLPETHEKIVCFKMYINSFTPDKSMFDVELEFLKFHKGSSVMLLSTKEAFALHDGEEIIPQSPAVIRDGSTLTPARFVAERFGAEVEWIASERKVIITKEEWTKDEGFVGVTKIELIIDSKTALVNGEEKELAYPACIIDDYTYTPARFVAENLGCNVDWDAQTKTVFIVDKYEFWKVGVDDAK